MAIYQDKPIRFLVLLSFVFFYFFFAGIRYNFGTDFYQYIDICNTENIPARLEFFWQLIFPIMRDMNLCNYIHAFISIINFLFWLYVLFEIYKKKQVNITLVYWFLLCMIPLYFGGLRQGVFVSFYCALFARYGNQKSVPLVLVALGALTFHLRAGLVLIVLIILSNRLLIIKRKRLGFFMILLAVGLLSYKLNIVLDSFPLIKSTISGDMSFASFTQRLGLYLILGLYLSKLNGVLVNAFALGFIIFLSFYFSNSIIAGRVANTWRILLFTGIFASLGIRKINRASAILGLWMVLSYGFLDYRTIFWK